MSWLGINLVDAVGFECDPEFQGQDAEELWNMYEIVGKRIWKDGVCSAQSLKLRLEVNQLERFGMLKKDPYDRLLIKKNTRLMYTQQKFNLFREENEGWVCKLALQRHA